MRSDSKKKKKGPKIKEIIGVVAHDLSSTVAEMKEA